MNAVLEQQSWLWLYGTNLLLSWKADWVFEVDWLRLDHFWTLAIEEQFYLVWPLVVYLLPRGALCRVCLVLIALSILTRTALILSGARPMVAEVLTPCRFDALAVGALCAILIRSSVGELFRCVRRFTWLFGLSVIAIALWRHRWSAYDPVVQSIGYTLLGCFFGGIILLCAEPSPDNRISKFFRNRLLIWFGTYSYGLYVFHVPLMPVFEKVVPVERLSTSLGSPYLGVTAYTMICIGVSSLVAYASWHLYEKHFLKLKRHFACR